mgnify:CR=1 FL=1
MSKALSRRGNSQRLVYGGAEAHAEIGKLFGGRALARAPF